MYTIALIESLIAIGSAAAMRDFAAVQELTIQAQNHALELERDLVHALQEKERLKSARLLFEAA
jgi:uncharacterized protein (UPF0264 family)